MDIQHERIAAGIVDLARRHPAYGLTATNFVIQARRTDTIVVFARSPTRIMMAYNSWFIEGLDDEELIFALAMMAYYVSNDLLERRGDRDGEIWQLACQAVATHGLRLAGLGRCPADSLDETSWGVEITIDTEIEQLYDVLLAARNLAARSSDGQLQETDLMVVDG